MILFKKRITKALISLRRCAGWSAPLLFSTPEDRFSRVEAHSIIDFNEVDMSIYLPKNVKFTEAFLMSTEIKVNNCFDKHVYDFLTVNENIVLHFCN